MGQPYLVQLIGSYLWDDIEDLARGMTARDARRAVADGTSSAASMRLPPETPACQPPETPACQHLEPAADAARWEAHQHNRHSTADSLTGSLDSAQISRCCLAASGDSLSPYQLERSLALVGGSHGEYERNDAGASADTRNCAHRVTSSSSTVRGPKPPS